MWCSRWVKDPPDALLWVQFLRFSNDLFEVDVLKPGLKSFVRLDERCLIIRGDRDWCSSDIRETTNRIDDVGGFHATGDFEVHSSSGHAGQDKDPDLLSWLGCSS